MKTNLYHKLSFLFLCITLLLASCKPSGLSTYPEGNITQEFALQESPYTPSPSKAPPTTPIPTVTHFATMPMPEATSSSNAAEGSVRKIYAKRVFDLDGDRSLWWWSTDSTKVYLKPYDEVWEYDIELDLLRSVPFESTHTPTPSIAGIPQSAVRVSISPSGRSAVYFLLPNPPAPTPTEIIYTDSEGGEGDLPDPEIGDLWLFTNGQHINLGQVEMCADEYDWAPDESKVFIVGIGSPSKCGYDGYLVNVVDAKVIPLFNRSETGYSVGAFSPNSQSMLCGGYKRTGFLNMESFECEFLSLPDWIIEKRTDLSWFGNEHFLIRDYERNEFFIFRISDQSAISIFKFQEIPELRFKTLLSYDISPDRNWMLLFVSSPTAGGLVESVWLIGLQEFVQP